MLGAASPKISEQPRLGGILPEVGAPEYSERRLRKFRNGVSENFGTLKRHRRRSLELTIRPRGGWPVHFVLKAASPKISGSAIFKLGIVHFPSEICDLNIKGTRYEQRPSIRDPGSSISSAGHSSQVFGPGTPPGTPGDIERTNLMCRRMLSGVRRGYPLQ